MTLRINEQALTFDDVLLQPAYSDVLPREVDLSTRLTRGITLNIPLVSAAMDTVTEAGLAIAIAQEGGIGIIHKSMTAEAQARHVRLVKKYESGVISDPITVRSNATIREVLELTRARRISGVPVVDKGVRKMDLWTMRHRLAYVAFDDDRGDPFFNVNRPTDLGPAEELFAAGL